MSGISAISGSVDPAAGLALTVVSAASRAVSMQHRDEPGRALQPIYDDVTDVVYLGACAGVALPLPRIRRTRRAPGYIDAAWSIHTMARGAQSAGDAHCDALRAYAPWRDCLGLYVDIWV